jgi:hypothetical protein
LAKGLPSKIRIGASFSNKILNLGIDIVAPLNTNSGNIANPVASLGGELLIFKIMRISTGMQMGGNYLNRDSDWQITPMLPVGITFRPFGSFYEFGIASRDILTYFRTGNPMISLSTGFLRFRI